MKLKKHLGLPLSENMDVEEDAVLNTSRELRNAYTRGSRVELTGLVSRASLNGILATVLEHISIPLVVGQSSITGPR